MNRENVLDAIAVMQKAKNLNMQSWQAAPNGSQFFDLRRVDTIEELHSCGNTACFVGYLAISGLPGWGFAYESRSTPQYKDQSGSLFGFDDAAREFLGISPDLAAALVYGGWCEQTSECLYPVAFDQVTPDHVISVLERILSGELQ